MSANERRKKVSVGVFNTSFAQNRLQRQSPNCVLSYWGGVLVSYICILYPVADKYDTMLLRNTKSSRGKIHKTHHSATVPGWRRMLLWIRSQISDWTFRFKMWEPDQHKKLTHTHWSTQFFGILFPTDKFVLYFLFHWNIFIKRCNKFLFSA